MTGRPRGPQHPARPGPALLPPGTPVPTPSGYRPAGHLEPGDLVYDHLGRPVALTLAETREDEPMVRLTIAAGTDPTTRGLELGAATLLPAITAPIYDRLRAGGPSLPDGWAARRRRMTPGEMLADGLRNSRSFRWLVPMGRPLMRPEAGLPLPPYAVGLRHANSQRDGTLRVWTKAVPWFERHLGAEVVRARGQWTTMEAPLVPLEPIAERYSLGSPDQTWELLSGLADGCRTSELAMQRPGKLRMRVLDPVTAETAARAVAALGHVARVDRRETRADNPRHAGKPLYDVSWTPNLGVGMMPQLLTRRIGSQGRPGNTTWHVRGIEVAEPARAVALAAGGGQGQLILVSRHHAPVQGVA